jgi:signal transduction histidine kinase
VTGLGLAATGWAAFVLAAVVALRSLHAAAVRGQAVARACHEVRGPLAAARLGLESSTPSPAPGRLRAIEVELARATAALDDLQAVERIELGPPEAGWVDVRSWLADSVEAWRPVAAARAMEVRLDWRGPDAAVWGRRSRLARVTGNLVANAIDHGAGPVEVRGRVDGHAVVIEVSDRGPGLPGSVAEWLAQSSRRGRRGREWGRARPNGHGHGLRIARAVAEAHGGRLTAAETERGARLVLTLPLVGR